MPLREYAGAAPATRLSGSLASGTVTNFTVITSGGSGYPTGATAPFVVVIDPSTSLEEKILVATKSGDTFSTLTRGYDGTTAQTHAAQAVVQHVYDAASATEHNAHVNTTTRDDHTQYTKADGTRFPNATHDVAGRHAFGAALGTPAVASTDSQTAAAAGSSTTPARDDHVHLQAAATPRGTLAYAERTIGQSLGASSTDVGSLTVTATLIAGRRYLLSMFVPTTISVGPAAGSISLMEGATTLATAYIYNSDTTSGFYDQAVASRVFTASAGSHTYKVAGTYNAGTLSVNATANNPAYILLEDIGV